MGYFSREDFKKNYELNDDNLPDKKKSRIDEKEWQKYKKKYVKNERRNNWEHDEDDVER